MAETKFVKARCAKTGMYFGLDVEKVGRAWKVVNMVRLSDTEGRVVSTEVEQASFDSADNLLACSHCGKRRVGGCACAKRQGGCSASMPYRFNCLYCNELKIDYSLPTRADVAGKGGTVKLSQGQEIKIRYADNRPLTDLYVGVGWDPADIYQEEHIDVDSSVVLTGGQSDDYEMVWFYEKTHPSGFAVHHGDNLTGQDIPGHDDENITVHLKKVPVGRDKVFFVLNIYKCVDRRQNLGSIRNLYIRISDPVERKALVEYNVTGNYDSFTSLIIAACYRRGGEWIFRAIGKGSYATNADALAEECTRYLI